MESIDKNELIINGRIGFGSYADVYKSKYKDIKYAYKEFYYPYIFLKKINIDKFEEMNNLNIHGLLVPNAIIKSGSRKKGYITPLIEKSDSFYTKEDLIELRNIIVDLHNNGIIHCDIHSDNIIKGNDGMHLIDADNSSFGNYEIQLDHTSGKAKKFIKKYGFSKDLDIYMFNLLTFEIMNKLQWFQVEPTILNDRVEYTSPEQKAICKSLILQHEKFNNNFLIDTYK